MALVRMTETISVDRRAALRMEEVPESLKESLGHIQKNVLNESVDTNSLLKQVISLKESSFSETEKQVLSKVVDKLRENGITQGPKLWKFPVARINDINHPNLNGRVYTRELWENVINKQRENWQGLCGLSDHPTDDNDPGQFKQSSIVWLDMMIDDINKIIWAIGSFVGQYGHLAQEIIEAGGRVGFSSSGYGELMMDGKTVNPDTYQIERVADIVLNPSQGVYGDIGDEAHSNIEYSGKKVAVTESIDQNAIREIPTTKVKESTEVAEPKSEIVKEKSLGSDNVAEEPELDTETNNNGETNEMTENVENTQKKALSEAEAKALRKYINQFLNEADNIKNPVDRLKELDEIMGLVESGEITDLKDRVQEALVAERDRLENMVESAAAIESEFGVDASTFAENAKVLAEEADKMEEANKQLNELNDKFSEQTADYEALCNALTERAQALYTACETLKEQNNALIVENSALKERADKVKDLNEQVSNLDSANKKLQLKMEFRSKRAESMKEAAGNNSELKAQNADLERKFNALKETAKNLEVSNTKLERKYGVLSTQYKELKGKLEEAVVAKSNAIKAYEAEKAELVKAKESAEAALKASQEEYNKLKETAVKVAKVAKVSKEETAQVKTQMKGLISDSPLNTGFYEGVDHNRMKGFVNFRENHGIEIEEYWNDLVSKYGEAALQPYERKIRGAKTLSEATFAFISNMHKIDENANKAADMLMDPAVPNSFREEINAANGYVTGELTESEEDTAMSETLAKMGWK